MDYIKNEATKLIKKYKTNDPYHIAEEKNILIYYEPLGKINGYYNYFVRQKFIHINSDLSPVMKKVTCAHELGHAILHPKISTPFLMSNTFFTVNKLERQANIFASELLLYDLDISKYEGYSADEIAIVKETIPEMVMYKVTI